MQQWTFPFYAMGSPCEIRLYAEFEQRAADIVAVARDEVSRLERAYSRYRDDSIVSRINATRPYEAVEVDDETAALLNYAQTAYTQSEGLFDITSGLLRAAWDFKSGRLPTEEAIAALLPRVGWHKMRWQAPFISFTEPGMQLDLGGYVKEYAVDAVVRLCRARGATAGIVDLGGDIHVIGPHPDGSPWQVGIRHPRKPEAAIISATVQTGAIASSGDYERYMEVDGRRYCHILNPFTGWPVYGLAAVAVAAPLCLLAGTAATIAMLKGREAGPAWLEELGLPYFWVTEDGESGGGLVNAV